jgi:hypothetical protein
MNAIRKVQVKEVSKGVIVAQVHFIADIFRVDPLDLNIFADRTLIKQRSCTC